MARQRISLSQSQKLRLNPSLHVALDVLRMDAGGLTRFLEEQAAKNPYLAVEEVPVVPAAWLPRWSTAFAENQGGGDAPEAASAAPSLMAHVLSEIETVTRSARERQIAMVLAEGLEPSGWLGRPLEELARQAGCAIGDAEAVLMRVQGIEPTGLFARGLAECLRLQAAEAGRLDGVMECLLEHLDLLATGQVAQLARMCGVTEGDILGRLRVIRSFDPKPGAQFDPGAVDAREPDLVVTKTAAGWDVQLNRSALPAVSVRRPEVKPQAEADRAALAEALGLRRMLERRNATLLSVAREVLTRQMAVLEGGLGGLLPLTLGEVARALDLHESTVSRVVAGVSVAAPQGTWRLRSLFAPKVGDASATALRDRIARLVADEDPRAPLTDGALTDTLLAEGRQVARRTVAKYREMLRIPTAGIRRRSRRH